jgi:hypothetical protein
LGHFPPLFSHFIEVIIKGDVGPILLLLSIDVMDLPRNLAGEDEPEDAFSVFLRDQKLVFPFLHGSPPFHVIKGTRKVQNNNCIVEDMKKSIDPVAYPPGGPGQNGKRRVRRVLRGNSTFLRWRESIFNASFNTTTGVSEME